MAKQPVQAARVSAAKQSPARNVNQASAPLLIIGTPVGNLQDCSPRVQHALASVAVLGCEDTRRTGQLLKLLGIKPPKLVAVHAHNEAAQAQVLIKAAHAGQTVGYVSDSGLPGISDPGSAVVVAARAAAVPVQVIPGPSAASLAVAGSGFAGGFLFYGFFAAQGERPPSSTRPTGHQPGNGSAL